MTTWPTAAVLLMVAVVGAGGSLGARCVLCACVSVVYVVCLYAGQAPPDGARTLWRCVCVQWVGSSRRDVHYCLCPPVCPGTKDEGLALRLLRPARTKDLLCVSYGTPGRRTCPVSLVRHARTKDLLGLA